MAADRSGRGAGRVEEHGVEPFRRVPIEHVGGDEPCREAEPAEVLRKPLDAGFRRGRRPSRPRRLPRAQRSCRRARRKDRRRASLRRRRGGGREAPRRHPAPTRRLPRSREARRRGACRQAGSSRSGEHAAKALRPKRRLALHARCRGRRLKMRGGDLRARSPRRRRRARRAKSQSGMLMRPATPGGAGEDFVAVAHQIAEHAVDEPARAPGAAVAARLLDGEVDGGVIGHVEEEDLRRGDVKDGGKRAGIFRQRPVERLRKRRLDLAAAAQRRRRGWRASSARSRRSSARKCGLPCVSSRSASSGTRAP